MSAPVVKNCQLADGSVVRVMPGGYTHFEDDLGEGFWEQFAKTLSYAVAALAAKLYCYGKGGHDFVFWGRWVPWSGKMSDGSPGIRVRLVSRDVVQSSKLNEHAAVWQFGRELVAVRDGYPQLVWKRCRRCRMWSPDAPHQEEITTEQVRLMGGIPRKSEGWPPKSPIARERRLYFGDEV